MGGSASTTAINALSQSISTMAISTVQSCIVNVAQSQDITVNNSFFTLWGTYTLQQQTGINSSCFSNVNIQTQLQNGILQAITQATTADGVALISAFGASHATATTNLTNIIKNSVTLSNIETNYNAISQT